jgi:hypothetical protein
MAHTWQAASLAPLNEGLYVPAGHPVGVLVAKGQYLPRLQGRHLPLSPWAVDGLNVPALQLVGSTDLAGQ